MDYDKTNFVDDFLSYKSHSLNEFFTVKIEINDKRNHWFSLMSEFMVENLTGVSDYRLTFMNDNLKYYLGYVQMGVNFLSDIRFDNGCLYFTTSDGKKVRLS